MVQTKIPESNQSGQQAAPVLSGAMDPALKANWVEAMRSGKYLQATGVLRSTAHDVPSFCCLGVLCDVAGAYWPAFGERGILNGFDVRTEGASYLSRDMSIFSGLPRDTQELLATMNDNGTPFHGIADWIEANIPTTGNSVTSSTDSRDGSLCESSLNNSSVSS